MTRSALSVRPRPAGALAAPSPHVHAAAPSFEAMVAEQLAHTPWVAVSVLGHALLLLLLWLLMPAREPERQVHAVAFVPSETVETLPIEPKPEVLPVVESSPDVTVETESPVESDAVHDASTSDASSLSNLDTRASAFDSSGDNPTLGIGGGAAGRGGPSGKFGPRYAARRGVPQVERALAWLVAHQDEDGHWDCDGFMKHDREGEPCTGPGNGVHDVGVTALALLAFLGEGSTLRGGTYREPLKRGVRWLLEQQDENGRIGTAAAADFVYDHAIATYALAEACGLSESTILQKPVQKALGCLAAHRNPYGAWRYQPRDGDADTSVTGWCALALASAKGFGFAVDDAALAASVVHFDTCTDATGRTGYAQPGEPSSRRVGDHATRFPPEKGEAMTAVALFCRCFLGQSPREEPRMLQAANLLAQKPPVWDEGSGAIDHYYWYYATYALYQLGGPHWSAWQRHLKRAVVDTQREDGNFKGSWDPVCVWGEDGGRVYSTAILALTLQVYYRYGKLVR